MSNWRMRQRDSLQVHNKHNEFENQQSGHINLKKSIYVYDPINPDFSVYQKPVSEERQNIFEKYSFEICKYLNAKFIIEEIVQPL